MTAPTLQQLAVLDWLHRWPSITLNDRGGYVGWSGSWANDVARENCQSTIARLGEFLGVGPDAVPGPTERRGYGDFDGTPKCQRATFAALLARGLVEDSGGGFYVISTKGREVLLRHSARLAGFTPSMCCGPRPKRERRVSAKTWRRYGHPQTAKQYADFHERTAAHHARLAKEIRESLALYEGSEDQRADEVVSQQEAWRRRKAMRPA